MRTNQSGARRFPLNYLRGGNALLAWRHCGSMDPAAFHAWAAQEKFGARATCAHSELGFLRGAIQGFRYAAEAAGTALAENKRDVGGFISASPSLNLPRWCRKGAQIAASPARPLIPKCPARLTPLACFGRTMAQEFPPVMSEFFGTLFC